MAEHSAISWCDATMNFWIGCTEVGPACDLCYARELDRRYQWGQPKDQRVPHHAPHWGIGAPRFRTSAKNWKQPYVWDRIARMTGKPTKVFTNSLADMFDKEVPESWRAEAFKIMRETRWLRWIVVTKRLPNVIDMLPPDWCDDEGHEGYPNVGIVATVCDQAEFDRDAPRLLSIPARWHGFSIEPQIGWIDVDKAALLTHPTSSVWFISGGESRQKGAARTDGHPVADGGRPWNPDWARAIINSCSLHTNMYAFVKQTGARPVGMTWPRDGMGKEPSAWPESIRRQQFPPELLS